MPRYLVQWDYSSSLGAFAKGDDVELDTDLADHINRSSPGVLAPFVEPVADDIETPGETRALDAPPHDRMKRTPSHKRGGGA
jgi:hypothetical protein